MNTQTSIAEFLDPTQPSVIVDVRSPSEYNQGHIADALNLPLFNDEERAEIGTLYVQTSREAAIDRGLEIAGPKMAEIVRTARLLSENSTKKIKLYCWRGGMRSKSVQWLLETAGIQTIRLAGGYKAYRNNFENILSSPWKFTVLSGNTGSGKTEILQYLASQGEQVLDLEQLASHKGSAFGALGQPDQPSTEEFINRIHQKLRSFDPAKTVWVEGESITIGHVFIPPTLFKNLTIAPIIQVEIPTNIRLKRILKEYGDYPIENLKLSFEKIRKRLGSDIYKFAIEALDQGDVEKAAAFALKYYDKCYTNSILKRSPKSLTVLETQNDNTIENAQKILALCKQS